MHESSYTTPQKMKLWRQKLSVWLLWTKCGVLGLIPKGYEGILRDKIGTLAQWENAYLV